MFGMVLNKPLSYCDSISYYNTDDHTAFPSSEAQVLNGQHKWLINLIFPLVQEYTLTG